MPLCLLSDQSLDATKLSKLLGGLIPAHELIEISSLKQFSELEHCAAILTILPHICDHTASSNHDDSYLSYLDPNKVPNRVFRPEISGSGYSHIWEALHTYYESCVSQQAIQIFHKDVNFRSKEYVLRYTRMLSKFLEGCAHALGLSPRGVMEVLNIRNFERESDPRETVSYTSDVIRRFLRNEDCKWLDWQGQI